MADQGEQSTNKTSAFSGGDQRAEGPDGPASTGAPRANIQQPTPPASSTTAPDITPPRPPIAPRPDAVPFCAQLMTNTAEAIVVQDMQSRVEWMNPAAERLFGFTLSQIKGQKVLPRVLPDDSRADPAKIASFRYTPGSPMFEGHHLARHKGAGGRVFWNLHSFTLLDTPAGLRVAATCRDVTEQVEAETALRKTQAQLLHAAHHDDLTGLANRKKLKHFLGTDLVRTAVAGRRLGVLQLDCDKFKEINDTMGHAAGDASLVHVADALRRVCGPDDLACRSGGDEFLLICLDITGPDMLLSRADALIRAASAPLSLKGQQIRVGLSIGACLASAEDPHAESLIHRADQALYAAKARGRGQVVLYTPELGQEQITQNQLARDIRLAVSNQEMTVHLQPQLDLASGRITGCETLLRWNHPDRGQLSPGEFLETARRTGTLADLDYHAMHLSLDALTRLHEAGFNDLSMSLNVSAAILTDANYPGLLDWALQSRGLRPNDICVEITETTIRQGGSQTILNAIERLKRIGVRVALDDFGTGYAGLAHISSIEVDEIKLDCSIIARLDKDPRNRAIVRSIIALCHRLGTRVVAEGVETAEQMQLLKNAGCPAIQGYILARPQNCDDMIAWLRANLHASDSLAAPG